jgi:hypothetical protein
VALVLRYYEDLPDDDIARAMECRPATVRTRIHRALTTLRKEVTPVTDTDVLLDPIERRLRHTFAVRAEDMAPGDGAARDQGIERVLARSADRSFGRQRHRRPTRLLLVAAIVLIVGVALAAVGVVVANDDGTGDETGGLASEGTSEPDVPAVALITAPRGLVTALEDERNMAMLQLIGVIDAVALPVDDVEQARSRTDAAAAAFESVVARDPADPADPVDPADPAGSAYQALSDRLDGLGALRRDIDADDGPETLDNVESATEVFDRYTDMIGGLLDAHGDAVGAIDDPDLRTGAQL